MPEPTVLVTAFEPFDRWKVNASAEAVNRLVELSNQSLGVEFLPVSFDPLLPLMKELVEDRKPDVFLLVGQSGGSVVDIERVAVNWVHARIKDNQGKQPSNQKIVEDGPTSYFSTLPTVQICEMLMSNGIPSNHSMTAGTYACNYVFYLARHYLEQVNPGGFCGFVHVPSLPSEVARLNLNLPSMSIELTSKALALVVDVSTEVWRKKNQ